MSLDSDNSAQQTLQTDCDILVVGAGLVGATLALRLESCGLRIGVLDRGELLTGEDSDRLDQSDIQFDPRVVALTAQSQRLFTRVGAWEQLEKTRHCPYQHMRVWEQDGTGRVEFHAQEIHEPALGTIIENSLILRALHCKINEQREQAKSFGGKPLQLYMGRSVEKLTRGSSAGSRPISSLHCSDGSVVSAHLVIAADGGNSQLRQLAGVETREWDYGQKAIVTTIRTREAHDRTALQRFLSSGPLAFLPLADSADEAQGHHCSIVWSADDNRADALMALDEERFNAELSSAMEGALGGVEWSDKRFVFPLRQRHAKRYVDGNIVLAGDAAHTIHPLAGQGVNLGLLDVEALAVELEKGLQAGRLPEDPLVLARYQRARVGDNLAMMGLMEGFKRGFGEESLAIRWLRNAGLNTVNRLAPVRKLLARRALGL